VLEPKLKDVDTRTLEPARSAHSNPNDMLIEANANTVECEEEVIHEMEEASSQNSRSKISVSVQSLRKMQWT